MTTRQHRRWLDWVDRYESAWRTPGTETLPTLFAPDAVYLVSPYGPAHTGLAAIAAMWEKGRDGADEEFTMTREVVAVDGSVGVVRCEVRYGGRGSWQFRDLWVVELDDDDRCVHYEEWPFSAKKRPTAGP